VQQIYPELAKQGIDIVAVDPGPTDTGWMTEEIKEDVLKHSSKGKINMPADTAHLIASLLTGEMAFTTGQVIHAGR
jgi:3-oxoacyl-[acyl-carrier protein] reductase